MRKLRWRLPVYSLALILLASCSGENCLDKCDEQAEACKQAARSPQERLDCLAVLDNCLNDCGLLVKPTAPPVSPDVASAPALPAWSPVNTRHD